MLSETERQFILGGVEMDIRSDGRGCRHVRQFTLKSGVVSNTSGSAMIERVVMELYRDHKQFSILYPQTRGVQVLL